MQNKPSEKQSSCEKSSERSAPKAEQKSTKHSHHSSPHGNSKNETSNKNSTECSPQTYAELNKYSFSRTSIPFPKNSLIVLARLPSKSLFLLNPCISALTLPGTTQYILSATRSRMPPAVNDINADVSRTILISSLWQVLLRLQSFSCRFLRCAQCPVRL